MNNIEIIHNPFIVDTQFIVNGQPPADGCMLTSYKESRLQAWIDHLFDNLSELFNGEDQFQVTFKGVESDYLDLAETAQVARERGMLVDLDWIKVEPAQSRILEIRKLVKEARRNEKFAACLAQDVEMSEALEDAFDGDFDVYVVATMSSGKSTLINAMLGCDLLPTANEATTATITRITDNDDIGERFSARRFNQADTEVNRDDDVSLATLEEWNRLDDTLRIEIEGNIKAIEQRESVRLVLTDTPGPNNSQDDDHERTTMGFVQDSRRNPLILYILNASQLGTNDDRNLLSLVAEAMRKGGKQSKDRFIFVVNKMDVFDPEKGEDPRLVLKRVRQYLMDNGISHPQIYPVSANLARLIRKPSPLHSRKERGDMFAMGDLFGEEPSMNLYQYMPVTARVRRMLEEKNHFPLLLASGLPAVETMIDEYIDKYNLPHRTKRAYDVLTKTLEVALNEVNLMEQLDQDQRMLDRIETEIENLKERKEKGFDTVAYKDRLERDGVILPAETQAALKAVEKEMDRTIKKISEKFTGTTTLDKAEKQMDKAEADLRFKFNAFINEYDTVFDDSQTRIKTNLAAEYKKYVKQLFKDSTALELPMLEGIRRSVADISLNLAVHKKEVKTRRVTVNSYQVSVSKWYNPFSWGDKETNYVYADEEYVDLEALWTERRTRIEAELESLLLAGRSRIAEGKETLLKRFFSFLNREFDEKFDALIASLEEKLHDRDVRLAALEEAKALHAWIKKFKARLDRTVTI